MIKVCFLKSLILVNMKNLSGITHCRDFYHVELKEPEVHNPKQIFVLTLYISVNLLKTDFSVLVIFF